MLHNVRCRARRAALSDIAEVFPVAHTEGADGEVVVFVIGPRVHLSEPMELSDLGNSSSVILRDGNNSTTERRTTEERR